MIKGILEFLAEKNRWAIAMLIMFLIVGGFVLKVQHGNVVKFKEKYDIEVKMKNALADTVTTYINKEGQWTSTKLTMQASIKDLEDDNVILTEDQKRLVDKVKTANKENKVITAALVRANFVIDSLLHGGLVLVDTTNKTVEFIEADNPDIQYDFKAFGVVPYPVDTKPSLLIKSMSLPNEVFVKFEWDENKRANYPIRFSITNSNDYVKVSGINSYAIPELQKELLDPNNWERFTQWLNKNGKVVGYVAGGIVVGAGGTYLFMK